ncbi:PAS domain S-box protein [Ostertagia ostertagi]
MRRANGDYVWVHAEGIALLGAEGRTLRFICSFIDISDAKQLESQMTDQVNQKRLAEQVLSIERDRLQLLVRTTKAGFSDWDAATEVMTYSDRYLEMTGHPAGTDTSGWPTVFMFMHDDDRERARAQFREMVEFTGKPGDTIPAPPMVGRLRTADGSYLWIHAESVSQIGDDGRTRRIITSYLDITVFREQQELLATERRRLDLVPNVPTLAEAGVADVNVGAWQGLMGPKGMPADVVRTLNANMNDILKMSDVQAKMVTLALVPVGGDPATLGKLNAFDHNRYAKVIKEFGIQAE